MDRFHLEPNDVVDVHLIGHSRGSVVISLAMRELLQENNRPQLQHGYMKMTLLDPHPANLIYGLNASINITTPGPLVLVPYYYVGFELTVNDPPVVVPGRVNEVEQFWQKNPWYICPRGFESVLNLQGLDPGRILYERHRTVKLLFFPFNLTGVLGIGHSEIHNPVYQRMINRYLPPGAPPGGGGGSAPPGKLPVFKSGLLLEESVSIVPSSILGYSWSRLTMASRAESIPALLLSIDRPGAGRHFFASSVVAEGPWLTSKRHTPPTWQVGEIAVLDTVWAEGPILS